MRRAPERLGALLLAAASLVHAADEAPVVARTDADGVQRVTIVGSSYAYAPKHVVVKAGVPVELTLRAAAGIVPHDFVLKAPEAGISISHELDDTPKAFRFVPSAAGRYPFYCSKRFLFFKSHRERGMEGVLEVVP